MKKKGKKIKKEFEKKFVKKVPVVDGFISYSYWTVVADPEDLWQFIEKALEQQKKEMIEKIIVWSRTHHTGNIDELYEVNLSDLLRYLEKV